MITWLRSLFGRRDAFGYRPRDRTIFAFWDGTRKRLADPLAVHRALMTDPDFELQFDPKIAQVANKEGLKATGRTAAAVRRAFGVKDIDAGGLLDSECLELFIRFGEYVGKLTDDSLPLSSGPEPMEVPASSEPATPNTVDYGSVESPTAAAT